MLPMLEDHREIDLSKAMYVPLGLASPLWLPFAAATGAGLTFWWMTRWTAPANLEAMMQAFSPSMVATPPPPALEDVQAMEAEAEEAVEVAAEAVEVTVEQAGDSVQTMAEAAADPAEPGVATAPNAPKKKAKPAPEAPLH